MEIREQAESCIRKCQENAGEMRQLAGSIPNRQAGQMFSHAAEKLEECIRDCRSALNQL
jgi:hypothetical protein